MPGPAGMETILLLVPETPLPPEADLAALLGDVGPPPRPHPPPGARCENGDVVRTEPTRGATGKEPRPQQGQGWIKQVRDQYEQVVRLEQQKKYAEAATVMEKILVILRQLYPEDKYPQGNRNLANALYKLGLYYHAQDEYDKAE